MVGFEGRNERFHCSIGNRHTHRHTETSTVTVWYMCCCYHSLSSEWIPWTSGWLSKNTFKLTDHIWQIHWQICQMRMVNSYFNIAFMDNQPENYSMPLMTIYWPSFDWITTELP